VAMEDVHPDNLALAVRAVAALKLDLAAVDFLIPDIRKSWFDVGAAICEINAQPQFGAGAPEWLFARIFQAQGRIPVVAVAGEAGWIDQVRVQARALGVRLGYACAAGTWVGETQVSRPLAGGVFQGVTLLVSDGTVDAILAVADSEFGSRGLPLDRLDAAVRARPGAARNHAEVSEAIARVSALVLDDGDGVPEQVVRVLAAQKAKAA
jgi:cyanophycin synthetase